jgi:hypothetical protein
MLTDAPVTSVSHQPSSLEHRFTGTIVPTSQPSQSEYLLTGDPIAATASQSPSKPPWLNWKLLKFVVPPILLVMFGPIDWGLN